MLNLTDANVNIFINYNIIKIRVSAPLEDLAPFLPKEELERNMLIPPYEE